MVLTVLVLLGEVTIAAVAMAAAVVAVAAVAVAIKSRFRAIVSKWMN